MIEEFEGTLHVDHKRGVVYFHLTNSDDIMKTGQVTILRICKLGKLQLLGQKQLDITHMVGHSHEAPQICTPLHPKIPKKIPDPTRDTQNFTMVHTPEYDTTIPIKET